MPTGCEEMRPMFSKSATVRLQGGIVHRHHLLGHIVPVAEHVKLHTAITVGLRFREEKVCTCSESLESVGFSSLRQCSLVCLLSVFRVTIWR